MTLGRTAAVAIIGAMAMTAGNVVEEYAEIAQMFRFPSWRPKRYGRGPGWTVAQVKRMATKARNQKRHKRAIQRRRAA